MKVGVVLCTYNGERYLRAQLESIAAQSRLPDVLLACDDASRDGTPAVLESWARGAPFEVRLIRNLRNLGYLRNFEQAISRCDADLIVLSDQDDCWRNDKLEVLENAFLRDPRAAAVFSDADMVDEGLTPLGYGLMDVLRVSSAEKSAACAGLLLPILLRRNIVAGATLALSARLKERILPMPEGVVHDEWIALIAAADGALRFVPERLISYRQHSANQIGARRWSFAEHFRRPLIARREENRRLLALMHGLRTRLGASDPGIDGKIAHLERRADLPRARLLRLPVVVAETANGGYARYSSGWRTALRDLLLP